MARLICVVLCWVLVWCGCLLSVDWTVRGMVVVEGLRQSLMCRGVCEQGACGVQLQICAGIGTWHSPRYVLVNMVCAVVKGVPLWLLEICGRMC